MVQYSIQSSHAVVFNATGQPIFPSNFVQHQCLDLSCHCRNGSSTHLGRVLAVGKDYRSESTGKHFGALVDVMKFKRLYVFPNGSKFLQGCHRL